MERDGPWCVYCGIELVRPGEEENECLWFEDAWWPPEHLDLPTADHVVPRKHGGRSRLIDLVLACRSCNSSKGTKSLLLFLATRRAA